MEYQPRKKPTRPKDTIRYFTGIAEHVGSITIAIAKMIKDKASSTSNGEQGMKQFGLPPLETINSFKQKFPPSSAPQHKPVPHNTLSIPQPRNVQFSIDLKQMTTEQLRKRLGEKGLAAHILAQSLMRRSEGQDALERTLLERINKLQVITTQDLKRILQEGKEQAVDMNGKLDSQGKAMLTHLYARASENNKHVIFFTYAPHLERTPTTPWCIYLFEPKDSDVFSGEIKIYYKSNNPHTQEQLIRDMVGHPEGGQQFIRDNVDQNFSGSWETLAQNKFKII